MMMVRRTLAIRSCRVLVAALFVASASLAASEVRRVPIALQADDVIPTGNEWISLPDIRASDAALTTFNALSMRDRGLLQVNGEQGGPVLSPYFELDGKPVAFRNPSWDLLEYWVPSAHLTVDGLELTVTYCAPAGSRAAFLRLTVANKRSVPAAVTLGVRAAFGSLSRVTYVPVTLRGERTVGQAPWVSPGEVFSYITNDTHFAWALIHPESAADVTAPPLSADPAANVSRKITLAPGASTESLFVLGVGIEEFSAAHNARALRELLERHGSEAILEQAAAWCRARTRRPMPPNRTTRHRSIS